MRALPSVETQCTRELASNDTVGVRRSKFLGTSRVRVSCGRAITSIVNEIENGNRAHRSWLESHGGYARRVKRGRLSPSPNERPNELLRLSGDLVERRVGDLVGLELGGPFDDLRQRLQHLRIARAAIGFRLLLRLPEADRERFRSARDDEGHFVLEAVLLSKQRNDFLLERLGELRIAVGFQLHANVSSVHLGLLEAL